MPKAPAQAAQAAPATHDPALLTALSRHIADALRAAGPQGAVSPFGLRAKAEKEAAPAAVAALVADGTLLLMKAGPKPRYVWAGAAVAPADALKALNAAKTRGLTADGLAKKLKVMTTHLEPALAALSDQKQAVAVRKAKTLTWYATPHRPPTLDDVTAKLVAALRGPALFDDADAKVTLTTRERPLLKQALPWLQADGLLRPLTHTKRKAGGKPGTSRTLWQWVLDAAPSTAAPDPAPEAPEASAPQAPEAPEASAPKAPEAAPALADTLRAAYAALRAAGAAPFVLIHALQARSGVPLAEVQAWLLAEAAAGRVQLTGSNIAALPKAAAEAAVRWRGEPCALARLVEEAQP